MFPMPAGVASAIGGQMSPKPEPGWIDMVRQIGLGLAMTNDFGKGIGMGVQNMQAAEKKRGLASALKGMAGSLPENQRAIVAQLSDAYPEELLQPLMATAFKPKEEAGGPFAGTSMDAQIGNILVAGEQNPALKQTPQYKFAVSMYTQPKVMPDGQGGYTITRPELPSFGGGMPQAAPQLAPQPQGPRPSPASQNAPRPVLSVPGASVSSIQGPRRVPTNYMPDPNGGDSVVPIPGGPEDPKIKGFTEAQSKANIFASRAAEAEAILEKFGSALQDPVQFGASNIPLVGNYMLSPEFQQADQAQRNMINAFLRRESGAVIGEQEFANAYRQYIPRPGDGPEVLAQKAANRRSQIEALKKEAGPAYGGVSASPAPAPGAPRPRKEKIDPTVQDAIAKARAAVANGKDPAAVAQRLREFGIDPSEAGLQ